MNASAFIPLNKNTTNRNDDVVMCEYANASLRVNAYKHPSNVQRTNTTQQNVHKS